MYISYSVYIEDLFKEILNMTLEVRCNSLIITLRYKRDQYHRNFYQNTQKCFSSHLNLLGEFPVIAQQIKTKLRG